MIPSRSHEINGSRPSPLKVGRESHSIRKTTSSDVAKHQPRQQRQPVIIYAHSPKVIHTRAQDFMALVQRLTGLSRSEEDKPEPEIRRNPNGESESSSVVTDEANGFCEGRVGFNYKTTPFSPGMNTNQRFLSDIPLFTPSSMALFGSPNPVIGRTEPALYLSPEGASSVSPSVFEFMKEFP